MGVGSLALVYDSFAAVPLSLTWFASPNSEPGSCTLLGAFLKHETGS